MANNIAVSITADVADLSVKRAIMSAELKAATKDLNTFAKEAAGGANTAELREGMLASAVAAEQARAKIALVNTELKEMKVVAAPAVHETERGFAALSATISETGVRLRETVGMVGELRESMMAFGELLLAAFAVEKIVDWAKEMAEAAEKTKHLSEQFGMTTDQVQQFGGIAAATGIPLDAITKGMGIFDKNAVSAASGAGAAAKAFKAVGISANDGRSQMDRMLVVADKFKDMADGPNKVALAMLLFGRSGRELIPVLNLGAEGLAKINEKTAEYGAVNAVAVEKGVALAESVNESKLAMQGVSNVMTDAFAPMLKEATDGLNKMIKGFIDSYREGGAAKIIFEGIAAAFEALGTAISALAPVFDALGTAIKLVADNLAIVLPVAAAIAVLFAGPMVAAFVASTVATIAQSAAMGVLVSGFISEGIIGAATAAFALFTTGIAAATTATFGFTVALLANPLTWIVGLCAAAAGGMVWLAMHVRSARDAFEFLYDGVKIVGAYILGEINVLQDTLKGFSQIAMDALTLNWGAIDADWKAGLKKVEDDVRSTANTIKGLMADAASHLTMGGAGQEKGDSTASIRAFFGMGESKDFNPDLTKAPKAKKEKKPKDDLLQRLNTELELQKANFAMQQEAQGTYEAFALESEVKFWSSKIGLTEAGSKDRAAVEAKWLAAVQALRKQDNAAALEAIKTNMATQIDAAKSDADQAKIALQTKINNIDTAARVGMITAKTALTAKRDLNQQILQADIDLAKAEETIHIAALEAELRDEKLSTTQQKKIRDQLQVEIAKSYDLIVKLNQKKDQQLIKDDNAVFANQMLKIKQIAGSFGNSISQMITLQQGFATTMKSLWGSVASMISGALSSVLTKYISQFITTMAVKLGLLKATSAAETGSAAGIAGANAVASMALAPFPLNTTAPAFGASMSAAAASFGAISIAAFAGGTMSAPGGWAMVGEQGPELVNLPRGSGVLTAEQSRGQMGGTTHINIHTIDTQSMARWARDNGHHLAAGVKKAVRDGWRG